jgi:hypothetical protein
MTADTGAETVVQCPEATLQREMLRLMNLSIACADVGSEAKGNFGWAVCDLPGALEVVPDSGSIRAFADAISERLRSGRSVALGFERPLFVPLRDEPSELMRARAGEKNRPWSAGAGCGSLATGLVQAAWVLDRVRRALPTEPHAYFRWSDFQQRAGGLFLWEAFVSGPSKSDSHHGDAGLAVMAFISALPNPTVANVIAEPTVYSLIGAALLRTGWSLPVSVLSESCLVLPVLHEPRTPSIVA